VVTIFWSKYPDLKSELILVEDSILRNVHSKNRLLSDIIVNVVQSGGKRLRPAFVLISSKFGRQQGKDARDKVLATAGAIELLHTATLIHDDVIDRSKLRRGRTTVSERYGIDMAVYAGDYLFTKSVLMLSDVIPNKRLDLIAKAIKTICEGEVDQYQNKYNHETTIFSYIKRIGRKTAVLFAAACEAGADITKSSTSNIKNLTRFGFYYGIAFQIRDDINDYISDAENSGKPVSKDIKEGIMTLPLIYAARDNDRVKKFLEDTFKKRENISLEGIDNIINLVKESKGINNAEAMLEKYIQRGINVLSKLPENDSRYLFEELILELKL
jgi:heptaprenyl diphosphate synthase